MSNYYNLSTEQRAELLELHLQALEKVNTLVAPVAALVKKFNNRVLNVYFERELKAIDSGLSYKIVYNSLEIKWYMRDNTGIKAPPDKWGYQNFTSICDNVFYLLWHTDTDKDKLPLIDRRLNASAIIEKLNEQATERQTNIDNCREQAKQAAALVAEKSALIKAVEDYNNKTNYLVAHYFDTRIEAKR